jgi:oligosaccharide reducing-end xylanase
MNKYLLLAIVCSFVAAFQAPPDYEVAPWLNWKQGVVTYSFDDGCSGQLSAAIPALNKYGLHATFNLVTNWVSNWGGWKQAAQNGHEIASHTVSHANLDSAGEQELSQSKRIIEQNIGQECVTIVYPNCVCGNKGIISKYYISGRTCSGQFVGNNPFDMYEISSFIIGNTGQYNSAQALNNLADQAAQQGKWAVFLIHGVDGDGGYSPISSSALDQHFNYVKQQDKVWVATMKEVSKYILEYKSLTITETGGNGSFMLDVSCQQSGVTKLDQPITIARKVSCTNPTVKLNGSQINSTPYNGKVIFNVIPGNKYSIQC